MTNTIKITTALTKARRVLLSCKTVMQLDAARKYILLCRKMVIADNFYSDVDYLKAKLEIHNLLADSFLLEKKLLS